MGNMKKAHNRARKLNRLISVVKQEVRPSLHSFINGWQSSKRNEVKMKIKEQMYCVFVTESDNFNPSALESTIAGVLDTEEATKRNLSVLLKIRSS